VEATQEAELTKPTETSTASVEATQEAEPTIEIVSTRKYVIATPTASFLGYVLPEPGSSYTIAEYNKLVTFSSDIADPSICFSIDSMGLMEKGDFPTMEQFLSWIYIEVDDVRISQYSSLWITSLEGGVAYDRFTNEILWKEPDGSPYRLCYAVDLGPGIHTATIFVEKSAEKRESYMWSFEITE
jgi:hypothetical protein